MITEILQEVRSWSGSVESYAFTMVANSVEVELNRH